MTPQNDAAGSEAPDPATPVLSNSRHDASEGVTWAVRVAGAWSWRLIAVVAAGYLVVRGITAVSTVAFALILALFVTAILHPLDRRLRTVIHRPKSLSSLLALLIGIAALGGVGYFVAGQISDHAQEFGNQLSQVVTNVQNWLQNGPLHISQSELNGLSGNITNAIKTHSSQIVTGAIDTVKTVVDVAESLLLIILATFFFLRDGELIWGWVVRLFPTAAHQRLDRAGRAGWHTFGGYMRGQLLIALFHSISVTVLLLILGVPLAFALGVVILIGSFIPILGLLVAGILCVAVTLLEHGLTDAIIVAVVIIVLVQAESHVLQPVIMSRSVSIHPLAVAVSVLGGTALAGIPGALISVPLVAFLNTTVRSLRSPEETHGTFPAAQRMRPFGRKHPVDEDNPALSDAPDEKEPPAADATDGS